MGLNRLLLRSMLCGSDDCGQEVCAYRRLALVVHLDGLVAIVADMILVRARSVPGVHGNLVHKPYRNRQSRVCRLVVSWLRMTCTRISSWNVSRSSSPTTQPSAVTHMQPSAIT